MFWPKNILQLEWISWKNIMSTAYINDYKIDNHFGDPKSITSLYIKTFLNGKCINEQFYVNLQGCIRYLKSYRVGKIKGGILFYLQVVKRFYHILTRNCSFGICLWQRWQRIYLFGKCFVKLFASPIILLSWLYDYAG